MTPYHKIPGPFKRVAAGPEKNKVIRGMWTSPELEVLANVPWNFSEKVDGTNIRLGWDGYDVDWRGRTDKAMLPQTLDSKLEELVREELFEETFGNREATLYGEGYGAKINGGGTYLPDGVDFMLFDVMINGRFLRAFDVQGIASALGLKTVYNDRPPLTTTLNRAIMLVEAGMQSSFKDGFAEGLVGTPVGGFLDRQGNRIVVKVKHCDLYLAAS